MKRSEFTSIMVDRFLIEKIKRSGDGSVIIFRVYYYEIIGTLFSLIKMKYLTPYRQNETSLSPVRGRGMVYGRRINKQIV